MGHYWIRTTKGNQGPFSRDDLQRLVDAGRLKLENRIHCAEEGRAVTVQEALANLDDVDIDLDVNFDEFDEIPAAAPPPRPARRSPPAAHRETAGNGYGRGRVRDRQVGHRAHGASSRLSSRRTHRPEPRGRGHTYDEHDEHEPRLPYRRRKSQAPLIILISTVVVLAVIGGVCLYIFWPGMQDRLEGTWVVDGEQLTSNRLFSLLVPTRERKYFLPTIRAIVNDLQIVVTPVRVRFILAGAELHNAKMSTRPQGGGQYNLTLTAPGEEMGKIEVTVRGNRLFVKTPDGNIVLRRKLFVWR